MNFDTNPGTIPCCPRLEKLFFAIRDLISPIYPNEHGDILISVMENEDDKDPHGVCKLHSPRKNMSNIEAYVPPGRQLQDQAAYGPMVETFAHEVFLHALPNAHHYNGAKLATGKEGHAKMFTPPDESNEYHKFMKNVLSLFDIKDEKIARDGCMRRYAASVKRNVERAARGGSVEDDDLYDRADLWAEILKEEAQNPNSDFWTSELPESVTTSKHSVNPSR